YAFSNKLASFLALFPNGRCCLNCSKTASKPSVFNRPTGPEASLFQWNLIRLKLKKFISSKSWSSVAIQYTGTKFCSGLVFFYSLHKLIIEIIFYKKYNGP